MAKSVQTERNQFIELLRCRQTSNPILGTKVRIIFHFPPPNTKNFTFPPISYPTSSPPASPHAVSASHPLALPGSCSPPGSARRFVPSLSFLYIRPAIACPSHVPSTSLAPPSQQVAEKSAIFKQKFRTRYLLPTLDLPTTHLLPTVTRGQAPVTGRAGVFIPSVTQVYRSGSRSPGCCTHRPCSGSKGPCAGQAP